MKLRVAVAAMVIASGALVLTGQQSSTPAGSPGVPSGTTASAQRTFIDQYCVGCHNQRAKTAGVEAARKLTLDDKDPGHVRDNAEVWERVVRKVRAGMMPPVSSGAKKPDPA